MTFFEDLKRPFNILTILLAIGSIILGLYFYYNPKKDKKLSYVITEPQQIFDSKISSPKIKVLDALRKPINHNIYVVTITLWNNGSEPIEPSDNRKPFTFKISNCNQILDFKILKEKDPAVSKFNLSVIDSSPVTSEKSIQLTWKHFDPKQGLSFQLIYAATSDYSFGFDSLILGLESISDARPITKRYSAVGTIMSALIGIFFAFAIDLSRAIFKRTKSKKRYFVVAGIFIVFFLSLFVLFSIQLRGSTPPF